MWLEAFVTRVAFLNAREQFAAGTKLHEKVEIAVVRMRAITTQDPVSGWRLLLVSVYS